MSETKKKTSITNELARERNRAAADRTLMAWWDRFDVAWPMLKHRYDERFYRVWRYYLMSCAGFFRSRQGQLWQLVLTKRARKQVYRSVR